MSKYKYLIAFGFAILFNSGNAGSDNAQNAPPPPFSYSASNRHEFIDGVVSKYILDSERNRFKEKLIITLNAPINDNGVTVGYGIKRKVGISDGYNIRKTLRSTQLGAYFKGKPTLGEVVTALGPTPYNQRSKLLRKEWSVLLSNKAGKLCPATIVVYFEPIQNDEIKKYKSVCAFWWLGTTE